jgi:hypothetical protein
VPETLSTVDGQPVDVDQSEAAFAAAMAAPPADRPGMAAPARKPPEPAPDPDSAPHGWTFVAGQWRPKKAPGRPRAAADKTRDKARVTTAPPAAPADPATAAAKAPAGKPDFRRPLKEALEALWLGLAITPVPETAFGFKLGGIRAKVRAQAFVLETQSDALVAGVNQLAQHNRFVRAAVSRLAAGEGGLWVLPTMFMLTPFLAQTGQLWGGQVDEVTLAAMAEKTEADAAQYLQAMVTQAQVDAMAETAMAAQV